LKGLASGLLWISQGVWLSKSVNAVISPGSEDIVGVATGIFFTVFNINGILGNIIGIILLGAGKSVSAMIWTMTGVAALGACSLSTIASTPQSTIQSQVSSSKCGSPKVSLTDAIIERLSEVKRVALLRETLYLAPYFFCQV
jgi:hypothetical protein